MIHGTITAKGLDYIVVRYSSGYFIHFKRIAGCFPELHLGDHYRLLEGNKDD